MAITVNRYDHTIHRFVTGANAAGDTYKLLLCSALTFNASHTTLAGITYTEIANGNGYTTGGLTLGSVEITQVGSGSKFDANDGVWTASGSGISAEFALLINDTDSGDPPVVAIDFGEVKTADAGTDFKVIWPTGGIVAFSWAA